MEFLKPKTSCKTSCFFLNDAMFWRCFWKNIDVDVFDDVLWNAKHRANDASNDVNRPPLKSVEILGKSLDKLNCQISILFYQKLFWPKLACWSQLTGSFVEPVNNCIIVDPYVNGGLWLQGMWGKNDFEKKQKPCVKKSQSRWRDCEEASLDGGIATPDTHQLLTPGHLPVMTLSAGRHSIKCSQWCQTSECTGVALEPFWSRSRNVDELCERRSQGSDRGWDANSIASDDKELQLLIEFIWNF